MRIGELLQVKVTDIILPERKILFFLGEKKGVPFLQPQQRQPQLCSGLDGNEKDLHRADLSRKGYSLHSLRHTFATDMLNAGLRLEVLQQLLGHKSTDITMSYCRLSNLKAQRDYYKAVDRIMEQSGMHYSWNVRC